MNKLLIDDIPKYRSTFARDMKKHPEKYILKPYIAPSEQTIKQYVDKIRKNHFKLSPLKCEDLDDIIQKTYTSGAANDYEIKYISRSLNYLNQSLPEKLKELFPNKNTLKSNLIPYVKLLRILADYTEAYKRTYFLLSKYILDLNEDYELIRDDNIVDDKDIGKIITDYDKATLLANVKKLDTSLQKMIYALYTMIPPRRLEYTSVIVTSYSYRFKMTNENNYLLMKKRKPYQFVWNNYKTSKAYGRVVVDIPDELADIILDYIKDHVIKTGDTLLDLQQTNFIRIIELVFKKVYDVNNISVRWLRISYATHIDKMNISNNEKQKITLMMGHSAVQSSKYRKILEE